MLCLIADPLKTDVGLEKFARVLLFSTLGFRNDR